MPLYRTLSGTYYAKNPLSDGRIHVSAFAWIALNFEEAPDAINLLDPELPTRRELIRRLRASNPTLTVLRLPRLAISFGGLLLLGASGILRPGKKAIDIRRVFARQSFDTTRARDLQLLMPEQPVPGERVSEELVP